ncbi:ABC transporter ATP-binding protein [Candidatus Gracilibacteria bacterium]|nr:ABC transporter ATP-binding protein [Candidatus Gracilibacteria bacterium]
MQNSLQLSHISKTIGKTKILDDISFDVKKGNVFGFIGANGAGKTTTLKIILGILEPTEGEIKIFGKNPSEQVVQKKIGFMPEQTYFYKFLTGEEFLDYSASFYKISKDILKKRKEEVLKKVGLFDARKKKLSTYSKGMLQRIGIAQAIVHDPEIIFLDEPMSGLDPIGRVMIKNIILELKNQGKTIFFNSHILSDVEVLCDEFAIIHKGKIRAKMPINELKNSLEDFFLQTIETSKN